MGLNPVEASKRLLLEIIASKLWGSLSLAAVTSLSLKYIIEKLISKMHQLIYLLINVRPKQEPWQKVQRKMQTGMQVWMLHLKLDSSNPPKLDKITGTFEWLEVWGTASWCLSILWMPPVIVVTHTPTYRQNLWVSFRKMSPFLQRVMLVDCSQNLMLRKAREESYM